MDHWNGIEIVLARTEQGEAYYLVDVDEDYSFIPDVKSYLDLLQARAGRSLSPNTSRTYCYHLRYFFSFLKQRNLGHLEVTYDDLVDFRLWLKNPYRFHGKVSALPGLSNLSESTINAAIDRVSSFYRWLKQSAKISDSPVKFRTVHVSQARRERELLTHTRRSASVEKNILKSREPKRKIKTVTDKEFKKLLSSVQALRDKLILLLLKDGGLRKGELLGIRLEDIEFGESGIWIRFRDNNSNKARAKGGCGRDRFVDLPADLMALIDKYIATEWLDADPKEDFLFIVQNDRANSVNNGKALTNNALMSLLNYHSKKNNISVNPHMLRHTHATDLVRSYINAGEPVNWEFIKERLGHQDVSTTINMYIHLTRDDYKKEYRRLAQKKGWKHGDSK